jgi:hypothetical protein
MGQRSAVLVLSPNHCTFGCRRGRYRCRQCNPWSGSALGSLEFRRTPQTLNPYGSQVLRADDQFACSSRS